MSDTATIQRPCLPADLGIDYTPETPQWVKDALEGYFAQFAAPRVGDGDGFMFGKWKCSCGRPLGGLVGTFTWGMAHGEGCCSECSRPARGKHYIKDAEGKEFFACDLVLLYHCDEEAAISTTVPSERASNV